jgi:hypothetical protein
LSIVWLIFPLSCNMSAAIAGYMQYVVIWLCHV